MPEGYEGTRFQASVLYFLASGCWRLRAEADDGAVLEVTVLVQPSRRFLRPARCGDLEEAVAASPWVVVGRVERTEPAPPGYVWQDVRVQSVWRSDGREGKDLPSGLLLLVVLQEEAEPVLLREGHDYQLFLHPVFEAATTPLGLICPAQTLAEVRDDRIVLVDGETPLWRGAQVEEVREVVQAAAPKEWGQRPPATVPRSSMGSERVLAPVVFVRTLGYNLDSLDNYPGEHNAFTGLAAARSQEPPQ